MNPAVSRRTVAYVGLGANLGDPHGTLLASVHEMDALPDTRVIAVSSHYRTAPMEAFGPDFINAVVRLDTELDAHALLLQLQRIESAHGRERPFVNAPRTLDLDLLLFGDERIDTPTLIVPHPRLHQRAFALAPLAELAPDAVIPGIGPVAVALEAVADQRIDRLTA